MSKYIKISAGLLILILLDQLSKYIIRIQGGFYICNTGIAFGIKIPSIFFYSLWISIIFFLILALYKKYYPNALFILLIISGAISNIIDRLQFGCVIDFIDLKFWPVFNLADIYITIGTILILLSAFKDNKKNINL